jgi:hypothetical protein
VIRRVLVSQHDTIKSVMVGELVKHFEAEAVLVEFNDFGKLIRGSVRF